jgi:hypothetical protein
MAVAPAGLDFQGGNRLREKSEQLEGLPFFLGKRSPFVVDGVFDQALALILNVHDIIFVRIYSTP